MSGSAMSKPSSTASADVNTALAAPGPNQMMASDIRGTRVYGANDESVGDISDILLSQDGDIVAMVVGVGGFLGIGQKDVAIPFQAFEFVTEGQPVASRTSTTTSTASAPAASPGAAGTTSSPEGMAASPPPATAPAQTAQSDPATSGLSGTTGAMSANRSTSAGSPSEPATTGSTPGSTAATSTTSATQQSAGLLKPERIVLRGMSKGDLEAAPEFKRTAATSGARGGTNR